MVHMIDWHIAGPPTEHLDGLPRRRAFAVCFQVDYVQLRKVSAVRGLVNQQVRPVAVFAGLSNLVTASVTVSRSLDHVGACTRVARAAWCGRPRVR